MKQKKMKKIVIAVSIIGVLALLFIVYMLAVHPSRKKEGFRLLTYEIGEGTRPGEMVFAEGGEIIPGIETPSFFVGINLVTQEEYTRVMGDNPSGFTLKGVPMRPHLPVENVTWFDAIEYCNRLSIKYNYNPCYTYIDENKDYGTNPDDWPEGWHNSWKNAPNIRCDVDSDGFRLPDCIEWEYAARGGMPAKIAGTFNYKYAGTDNLSELPDYAWFLDNAGGRTHTVGTKLPNELGVYDMSGNVWEYCYTGQGSPIAATRGGSYCWSYEYCAVNRKFATGVDKRFYFTGFRVFRTAANIIKH